MIRYAGIMKLHFLEASSQREELFQTFTFIIKCKTSTQNTVIMHQLICTLLHCSMTCHAQFGMALICIWCSAILWAQTIFWVCISSSYGPRTGILLKVAFFQKERIIFHNSQKIFQISILNHPEFDI